MGTPSTRPLIFDAGALIALERRDARIMLLLQAARQQRRAILISAAVLAQVWRGGRDRQAPIALLLRRQAVTVIALDENDAKIVGLLCAATGHRDIADAHVASLSLRNDQAPVVTSDRDDIARFSPAIPVVSL